MASRHPLTLPERAAARLLCGPVGHLAAGLVDWVVLLSRYAWARARGRTLA
ncbi:hypothetical protein GKE82_00170 [Conexibacter sp. W3-3-2]|uniref:hypothetical protein n=1 Tax=Solirubrobacterales TaxID=588673 RepID=UPI0012B8EE59|nr:MULTISPECIES: hypothetical protein [Solirubrobacterales]MTD42758.1 hypothetical protein [Conexibacter sp. W3-3-2]